MKIAKKIIQNGEEILLDSSNIVVGGELLSSIFEEGEWTPTIYVGDDEATDVEYNSSGRYIKIGNMIHCTYNVNILDRKNHIGTLSIGGLPYVVSHSGETTVGRTINIPFESDWVSLSTLGVETTNRFRIFVSRKGRTGIYFNIEELNPGNRIFRGSFIYYTK